MTDDHSAGIDKEPLRPGQHSALSTILTVLLALIILWLFINVLMRPGPGMHDKAREAESKANLHNIQLSIERYAVDHGGEYPAYLIGGEPKYAARVDASQSNGWNAFTQISDCNPTQVSDPLLRAGYIDAYPRNPFVRDGMAIHAMQANLPTSFCGNDPLRNGAAEAAVNGTRFGPYCTTMGQVLCDPRYTQWEYRDPATSASEMRDTWATVEYRMWDMWPGKRSTQPYLLYAPGQFFYKSMGDIVLIDAKQTGEATPLLPQSIDLYMLGVYGGLRTRGKDILGTEAQADYWFTQPGSVSGVQALFWPWTRSQNGSQHHEGSPFLAAAGMLDEQVAYGNPNGIPDGLILVVTAGEDW